MLQVALTFSNCVVLCMIFPFYWTVECDDNHSTNRYKIPDGKLDLECHNKHGTFTFLAWNESSVIESQYKTYFTARKIDVGYWDRMLSGHWSSYVYFDKRKHELKQKYYVVNVKFAYFIALKENGFIYIFTPAYNVYFGVYTFRMYNVNFTVKECHKLFYWVIIVWNWANNRIKGTMNSNRCCCWFFFVVVFLWWNMD